MSNSLIAVRTSSRQATVNQLKAMLQLGSESITTLTDYCAIGLVLYEGLYSDFAQLQALWAWCESSGRQGLSEVSQ